MVQTAVSLTIMQDVIARALARYPQHRARIEKAAMLIALGHVERNAAGQFVVRSQEQPGHRYAVCRDWCSCEDQRRHQERACKHRTSVILLTIAEERQRVIDRRERFAVLSAEEQKRLDAVRARVGMGV